MKEEKDINGLLTLKGCPLTEYTRIKNCYISDEYNCDDLGVVSISKKEAFEVCSPISLVSIKYDSFNCVTYYEFEYINKNTRKKEHESFDAAVIGKSDMIQTLKKKGVSIVNDNSFNKFINVMIRINEKVIDYNFLQGNETKFLQSQVGANSYGWIYTEDGYQYDKFNKKEDIIYKNPDVDGPLFQKKGSLEAQLDTMEKIGNDFKNKDIFQAALAFSYTGIILPACCIDNPVFLLTGPSGCGKQICSDMSVGQLGKNHMTGRGLQRASGDTEASRNSYRTKFGNLTIWVDEMQDKINKNRKKGISASETIKEEAYEITVGTNGSRATEQGKIRDDMNISHCPVVFCAEGNQFQELNDGGSSRILIIDSGLSDGESFLKSGNTEQYRSISLNNYGYTSELFINYIQELMLTDDSYVYDEFKKYKEVALKYTVQDKIANNMALLALTYNLMVEAKCVPESWEQWDLDRIFSWISNMNEFKSSTKIVVDSWIDSVITNGCIPYIQLTKGWKQEKYDELSRNPNTKIRGKKEVVDNNLYVYIPLTTLREQLEYEAKRQGISGFCFDINRLAAAGYLKQSSDLKHPYRFRRQDITCEYNPTLNKRKEDVCIVQYSLSSDDVKEHEKQMTEDQAKYNKSIDDKAAQMKAKLKDEKTVGSIFDI